MTNLKLAVTTALLYGFALKPASWLDFAVRFGVRFLVCEKALKPAPRLNLAVRRFVGLLAAEFSATDNC